MNNIRDKSGQAEFDAMRERSQHTKDGLLTDKMRYRKALLLACGGDEAKARQFLREVDGEPALICLTPAECKSPVACEVKNRCLRIAGVALPSELRQIDWPQAPAGMEPNYCNAEQCTCRMGIGYVACDQQPKWKPAAGVKEDL